MKQANKQTNKKPLKPLGGRHEDLSPPRLISIPAPSPSNPMESPPGCFLSGNLLCLAFGGSPVGEARFQHKASAVA